MKRLMMGALVALSAVAANAAAYTWGFTNGADSMGSDGDYLGAATAFLFLGTVAQTDETGGYSLDFSGATKIAGGAGFTDPANDNYTIGGVDFSSSRTSDSITSDATQTYTLLLLEEDNVSDYANYTGQYYLYTGQSRLRQDIDTSIDYAEFNFADAVTQSDWRTAVPAAEPVPEPTSGLLVLLGVAGLALKRKRA